MTYTPDIPQDLPSPAEIVGQIRTNFSQYAAVFDNNHSAINASTQGKHTNVILQKQSSDPTIEGDFADVFSKDVTSNTGTTTQAFGMIPQFLPNDIPNTPQQLTFDSVNTSAPYQTFLPGGYIVYFDTIPSAVTVNTTVSLSPQPSEILCVIPNPTKVSGVGILPSSPIQISVTVLNNFQFTINSVFPTGTGNINWIAIARQ